MFYMVLARFAYALPVMIYGFLFRDQLMTGDALTYTVFWITLLLSSVFFFSIGKFSPALLAHACFVGDAYLMFRIGMATGDINYFLMVLLSSFFAIEALRNDALQVLVHFALLAAAAYLISQIADVGVSNFMLKTYAPYIVFSPLVCRGIMSAFESKDVVVKEIIKKTRVIVPMADEEKIKRAARDSAKKAETFKQYNKDLQDEVNRLSKENEKLKTDLSADEIRHEISEEIVMKYMSICAEPPADLTKPVDDNILHILNLTLRVLGAKYAAFIYKDGDEVYLSNSAGVEVDEDAFVEAFADKIYETIDDGKIGSVTGDILKPYGFKSLCFAPVSFNGVDKGVLIEAFNESDKGENAHYANLCAVAACRIFSLLR